MSTVRRRAFLRAAGLSTVAVGASPSVGAAQSEQYRTEVRPVAALGVGRGQGFSLTLVFIPTDRDRALSPLPAHLVIYDVRGERLAEDRVELQPFSGATIEYELPRTERRRQLFGYGFVGAERLSEVYATIEVFDVASGGTIRAMVDPTG